MLTVNRGLAFASPLARTYATRYPRPRPGTSERPAYHAPDPLVNNPDATEIKLEDENLTFIHRPPPSVPSPVSLTTAPISPLLRGTPSMAGTPVPPLMRREKPKAEYTPVSPDNIQKMKQLRSADPKTYSTQKLAEMFGCSRMFVVLATRIRTAQRTEIRTDQAAAHAARRARWSERHELVKSIKARRRQLW